MVTQNIVYGNASFMNQMRFANLTESIMKNSNQIDVPALDEYYVNDVHPFNGILMSLNIHKQWSGFYHILDEEFQESLKNYLENLKVPSGPSMVVHNRDATLEKEFDRF